MNYWTRSVPDTLLFTVCFLNASLHGQSETSSLCVAPNSAETPQRCAPGLCDGGELPLKIDRLPVQSWPKSESIRIDGLVCGFGNQEPLAFLCAKYTYADNAHRELPFLPHRHSVGPLHSVAMGMSLAGIGIPRLLLAHMHHSRCIINVT